MLESSSGNNASRASWNRDVGCTSWVNANAAVEQGREKARVSRCPTDALTVSDGELAVADIEVKEQNGAEVNLSQIWGFVLYD